MSENINNATGLTFVNVVAINVRIELSMNEKKDQECHCLEALRGGKHHKHCNKSCISPRIRLILLCQKLFNLRLL